MVGPPSSTFDSVLIILDTDDAEFTGAQERIALSKKGRKEEEKKRKKGIVELIEEAYVFNRLFFE